MSRGQEKKQGRSKMRLCENCNHHVFCAIERASVSFSEGTHGVAYPTVEGAMLSIINSNRHKGYNHDYNGYWRLIDVRVPGGCSYVSIFARYNAAFGCYVFLKSPKFMEEF
jgi:hypothetical protein